MTIKNHVPTTKGGLLNPDSCPHSHTVVHSINLGPAEYANILRPDYADHLVCLDCLADLTELENQRNETEIPF